MVMPAIAMGQRLSSLSNGDDIPSYLSHLYLISQLLFQVVSFVIAVNLYSHYTSIHPLIKLKRLVSIFNRSVIPLLVKPSFFICL